jgi:hypothetical protein
VKILNLDDLETPQADISIVHNGESHTMRVLTVDRFIEQQKRATKHQEALDSKVGELSSEGDTAEAVQLIKDSVSEFFPTLPLGEMETSKMFAIFNWLGELSAHINDAGAPDEVVDVDDSSTEGNVPETSAAS